MEMVNGDGFNGDSNGDGDVDGDGGDGYGDHHHHHHHHCLDLDDKDHHLHHHHHRHHHRDNGGSVDRMEAPPLLPPDLEIHPPYENLFLSLLFFIHFISLCFFICRLSLFSIHPRIFHPPYAPFFYFSQICQWASFIYLLCFESTLWACFCYPSIILPLYKTLFYLSHRFEIFGQWKFPSIFSLRLLFPWEGNDASNFL